jgi:hypothetical protein
MRGRHAAALLAVLLAIVAVVVALGALVHPAPVAAESPPAPAPAADADADAAAEPAWQGGTLEVEAWEASFDVVPVGLAAGGALVPPVPLDTLGWWSGGADPGSGAGAIVLAVHRDSRVAGRGPFASLEDLPQGSLVTLDGHRYALTTLEVYEKATLPAASLFAQRGPERLVVVTCGGDFVRGSGYDSNVVATFEPTDAA